MRNFTELLKRPLQNIKSIDYSMIGFVVFWMLALLAFVIPIQYLGAAGNAFSFLFSFDFLETIEIEPIDSSLPNRSMYEVAITNS